MNAKQNVPFAIAIIVVAIVGGWSAGSRLNRAREEGTAASAARDLEISRLRATRDRLAEAPPKLAGPANERTPLASALPTSSVHGDALRTEAPLILAELLSSKAIKLEYKDPDVLTPEASGGFSPEFGKLFGLDEIEMARLRAGMTTIREQIESAIVSSTTVSRDENGSISIAYPPVARGDELRQQTRELMIDVMGQQRFDALLAMRTRDNKYGTPGIDAYFNAFGRFGISTVVTKTDRGIYSYRRTSNPPGGPTGGSGGNQTRENLIKQLGLQAPFVPADF